jgi:hypothetical protein
MQVSVRPAVQIESKTTHNVETAKSKQLKIISRCFSFLLYMTHKAITFFGTLTLASFVVPYSVGMAGFLASKIGLVN